MKIDITSREEMQAAISQTVANTHIATVQPANFSAAVNLVDLTPEVELNHLVTQGAPGRRG